MIRRLFFTTAILMFSSYALVVASKLVPGDLQTCLNPQPIAPMQLAGGASVFAATPLVWNGRDYAAVWVDGADMRLHFRRFLADGRPAAPAVTLSALPSSSDDSPSLVWTGTHYGVVWIAGEPASWNQVYFLLVRPDGAPEGAESMVSHSSTTCYAPSLAWSGTGYCVAWHGYSDTNFAVLATLLDSDGSIAGGGAYSDIPIIASGESHSFPSVAWSSTAQSYEVVWDDYSSQAHHEIWGAQISPTGIVSATVVLISGPSNSRRPNLCASGNTFGVTCVDYRNGYSAIYFAKLNASGMKIGNEVALTNGPQGSSFPKIVWTGAEYGVFFVSARTGTTFELYMQRVDSFGTRVGTNIILTSNSDALMPFAAFGLRGYLASARPYNAAAGGPNFVQAIGCMTMPRQMLVR